MSLVTPIGIPVPAFDAETEQIFKFTVQGGDQVVGNILTIIDNETAQIVYRNTVMSYVYSQTVPAHTLTNNKYYGFYFQTINIHGDISNESELSTFRTFTAPNVAFTNIPSSGVIESGVYSFTCQYSQVEGELLNTLYFYLYDATRTQIDVSEVYTSPLTPPIDFTHQFRGLIDDEKYYIRAIATTIYNTVVDTGYVEVNINYAYEGIYSPVIATNVPNSGYVQISNDITEIDGQVYDKYENPIPPTYVDGNALLLDEGEHLVWKDGFSFANNKFAKQRWWSPVWWGRQNKMSNYSDLQGHETDGRSYFTVEFKRGIPVGQTGARDYVVVKGYVDGRKYLEKVSNYITPLNNMSSVTSFLKVEDSDVTLEFVRVIGGNTIEWNGLSDVQFGVRTEIAWLGEPMSIAINIMDWDTGSTNVEFSRITDLFWEGEPQAPYITEVDNVNAPPLIKYITNVRLDNAIVRDFYVTHDVTQPMYYSTLPDWDGYTIMRADFDNNIRAGNVDWMLNDVNRIKVKRRKVGAGEDYITLYVQKLETVYDLDFYYRDYYVPSGGEYEYAMVPCVNDDEQNYFTTTVKTHFDGLFVSDKDKTMKLYANYLVSSSMDNILVGTVQPYNRVYPVVVKNPNVLYRTVTFQGDVLGLTDNCQPFELNDEKRPVIVAQKREWDKFLCNGRAKIIKDWNGNIILCHVTTAPSYTYDQTSGNSKPTMSFGVTEVGEYDSQYDMYKHGLIDVETT